MAATKGNPAATPDMKEAARLFSEQNLDGAEKICLALLADNENHADALNLMGGICARRGRIDDAISYISKAGTIQPQNATYPGNLARMYMQQGRHDLALDMMMKAITLDPENQKQKTDLVFWLQSLNLEKPYEYAKQALAICLEDKNIVRKVLLAPWLNLLARDNSFAAFGQISACTNFEGFVAKLSSGAIDRDVLIKTLNEPVLLAGLPVLLTANPPLENILCWLRRYLLETSLTDVAALAPYAEFIYALGLQCFQNEYVFLYEKGEQKALEMLQQKLSGLDLRNRQAHTLLALYACYKPLGTLPQAEEICAAAKTGTPRYKLLVERQIEEPRRESDIKKTIPVMTEISDEISEIVRAQYEENPYPRWLSWPPPQPHALADHRCESKTILNAGCGTGQEAISAAAAYPYAQVTAVDLSLSSLAYAIRKAEESGLNNVKFGQADILQLGAWDEKFDVIMSSGVLHHMDDPAAGWRVLAGLLKPGGVMKIALYSELGREAEIASQQWIRDNSIPATEEGIHAFRRHVLALDDSDPMKGVLRRADFYSLSQCRDLVFHVMEHRFSCPEIETTLDDLGLKFLGFQEVPAAMRQKYARTFPDDPAMTSLWNWHKFEIENPLTFTSMYIMWCCRKNERPEGGLPAWLRTKLE